MRIKMKVSTAGIAAHASLPHLPSDGDKFLLPDGKLDYERALRFYSRNDWARLDNDDDADVLAVATEFIDRLQTSFQNHAKLHADEIEPTPTEPHKKDKAERAMDRGRYAIVAIDLKRIVGGFRIRIGWANPHNAVGETDNCADTFARAFAAVTIAMVDDWHKEEPRLRFDLVDGDNCNKLFMSVADEMRQAELRREYEHCPNRINGYCSPCRPSCPFYRNGKCSW